MKITVKIDVPIKCKDMGYVCPLLLAFDSTLGLQAHRCRAFEGELKTSYPKNYLRIEPCEKCLKAREGK